MFFRKKRSGGRSYLQIVKNKWDTGKTRQKVIATVGRLDKLQESGELEALIRSGCKFCKTDYSNYSWISDDTVLTSHQVSKLLQVSPSTVVGWINRGKLEAFRTPGGHRRVRAADLKAFLEATQMPLPAELDRQDGNKLIFVVDDDPLVIRAVQRAFAQHGGPYEVDGCSDGVEALVMIGARKPDLVLLDIYMEGIDGFEVCRRLRLIEHLGGLQIVAITAYPSEEARARILDYGAQDYWVKPVQVEQAIRLLEECQKVAS